MNEMEFIDASDEALGVVNDKLRRRLFNEAYNYVRTKDGMADGVSIARLARILHLNTVIVKVQCRWSETHPVVTYSYSNDLYL